MLSATTLGEISLCAQCNSCIIKTTLQCMNFIPNGWGWLTLILSEESSSCSSKLDNFMGWGQGYSPSFEGGTHLHVWGWGNSPSVYLLFRAVYWSRQPDGNFRRSCFVYKYNYVCMCVDYNICIYIYMYIYPGSKPEFCNATRVRLSVKRPSCRYCREISSQK